MMIWRLWMWILPVCWLWGCVGGCSIVPPFEEHWVQRARIQVTERLYRIQGRFTVEALGRMLTEEYGVGLVYPGDLAQMVVTFPHRKLTEGELIRRLERETSSQAVRIPQGYELFTEGSRFQIPVDDVELGALPDVEVYEVGGRVFASGDYDTLVRVRRALDIVRQPRRNCRVRVIVVDDSKSFTSGIGTTEAFSMGYQEGWFWLWNTDVIVDAFYDASSVVADFEGIVVSGVDVAFGDTQEERLETFSVIQGGNAQASTFETYTAGFQVELRGMCLERFWRLEGRVEVSDFRPGGNARKVSRSMPLSLDVAESSMVRVGRFRRNTAGGGAGVNANRPGWSFSRSSSTFSVWVAVEGVDVIQAKPATASESRTGPKMCPASSGGYVPGDRPAGDTSCSPVKGKAFEC